MRFNGKYPQSKFTELMTTRDASRFRNAFEAPNKHHIACQNDRQWVRDVFTVFAMSVGVTESVAIQAFKTGEMPAIYKYLQRWVGSLSEAEHEAHQDTKPYRIGSSPQVEPALKALQDEWVRALGVRHGSENARPLSVMSYAAE